MLKYFPILSLTIFSIIFCQNNDSLDFNKMDKSICRIYIHQKIEKDEIISMGSGIVVSSSSTGVRSYYVFTAHHVIDNLLKLKQSYIKIYFTDIDNNILYTKELGEEHIIWKNESMDAAIISIPKMLTHKKFQEGYIPPGLEILKLIGDAKIGEDIYMLGERWLKENYSISILKKGVISTLTNKFPGYKGHYIYLIDKMANKGMSGGLIYNTSGKGIAMISSYVVENDKKIRTSDDLTVGIPLSILFNQLEKVIVKSGEQIKSILGY